MAISDELYDKIETMKWYDKERTQPKGHASWQWIHLADAVDKGNITPGEAYDTITLGWVAENLLIRESRYSEMV